MKAPPTIDRFLRSNRFVYGKPYYQRMHGDGPLVDCVFFAKEKPGLSVHVAVAYPAEDGGGPLISPIELLFLYRDGRWSGSPSTFEHEGFWSPGAPEALVGAIRDLVLPHLERIADPRVMVSVLKFLLGHEDSSSVVLEFPELAQSWVQRKETPQRLLCLAAYLNVCGRFAEAAQVIQRVARPSPFDLTVLGDAKAGEIRYVTKAREYLASIEAR